MPEPTEEMHDYMHMLTGKNPRDYVKQPTDTAPGAAPAGAAPVNAAPPPAAPSAVAKDPLNFSPLKPPPSSLLTDPKLLQGMAEAERWVRAYLTTNGARPAPGSDPSKPPAQMVFNGEVKMVDVVIATTVAAGHMANMTTGATGRALINESLVRRIIDEAVTADPPKKDDDPIDTTVEVTNKHVETQIQITIKLRAVPDDKRTVILLPDIEVTLHIGNDADSSSVEAQLNLIKIKKDVSDRMVVNGHVIVQSINFKAGVSGEANMTDVALMRIQKSLEVKMKAELEFKITDHISFSIQAEGGRDGVVVGPALTYHF